MNTDSLSRWVDELQGQIDDLKKLDNSDPSIIERISTLESAVSNIPIVYSDYITQSNLTIDPSGGYISAKITLPIKESAYDFAVMASFDTMDIEDMCYSCAMGFGNMVVTKFDTSDSALHAATAMTDMIKVIAQTDGVTAGTEITLKLENYYNECGFVSGNYIKLHYVVIATKKPATRSGVKTILKSLIKGGNKK